CGKTVTWWCVLCYTKALIDAEAQGGDPAPLLAAAESNMLKVCRLAAGLHLAAPSEVALKTRIKVRAESLFAGLNSGQKEHVWELQPDLEDEAGHDRPKDSEELKALRDARAQFIMAANEYSGHFEISDVLAKVPTATASDLAQL